MSHKQPASSRRHRSKKRKINLMNITEPLQVIGSSGRIRIKEDGHSLRIQLLDKETPEYRVNLRYGAVYLEGGNDQAKWLATRLKQEQVKCAGLIEQARHALERMDIAEASAIRADKASGDLRCQVNQGSRIVAILGIGLASVVGFHTWLPTIVGWLV